MVRALIRRRRALDPSARLQAVNDLPQEPVSCVALLEAASDPSLDVARAALARLSKLGGEREAAALRARLLSVDLGVVPAYATTLRVLADLEAAGVARRGLTDPSPTVRIAAALALRELRDPASRRGLLLAVGDPISGVRRFALDAVAQLGPDLETEDVCGAALHDPDAEVRAAAVRALAHVASDAEGRLADVRDDPAPRVRHELARLSPRLGDALVRSIVLGDSDPDVRAEAVWRLVATPRPSLLDTERAAADDPDWHVRWAACRALGATRDERARDRLVSSLVDPHETVRAAAARALAEIFGERLVAILAGELGRPEPAVRRALVYRLAELGGAAAVASIAALAGDASPEVREAVVHGLAQTHTVGSVPVLERLTQDENRDVRAVAGAALDRMRGARGG